MSTHRHFEQNICDAKNFIFWVLFAICLLLFLKMTHQSGKYYDLKEKIGLQIITENSRDLVGVCTIICIVNKSVKIDNVFGMKESGGRIMLPSQVLRKDKKEYFNRTCIIEVHIKRQSGYSINSFYGITRKSFGSLASRPPNDNSVFHFLCLIIHSILFVIIFVIIVVVVVPVKPPF